MPEPLFVEQLTVMAPPGFRDAVRDAARQEGQTASEYIRQAIRAQLQRNETTQPADRAPWR